MVKKMLMSMNLIRENSDGEEVQLRGQDSNDGNYDECDDYNEWWRMSLTKPSVVPCDGDGDDNHDGQDNRGECPKESQVQFHVMMGLMIVMVTMMMIKMKTLEENVQNKARCSPMWAARPVLPPSRLWSNFAPRLLLRLRRYFEDGTKMMF